MKKVKIIAGISWAFICLIVIIVLFPGLNSFSVSVSKLPFMKLNPRYTGGEIASQVVVELCTLDIRKPVFNGFLKEKNSGFVQLDWHGTIPETIKDSIDYDHENSRTVMNPINSKVKNVVISTPTSYGWAVRVGLIK